MEKIISLIRHLPGFRSEGHPVRKIIAGIFYSFLSLILISAPFAPPSFTLTKNQVSSDSNSVRISGHATDRDSEILLITNGQTITKVKPDPQTLDFYIDLSDLKPGSHIYSTMICSTKKSDKCSSRQEVTVTITEPTTTTVSITPTILVSPSPIPSDLFLITNVIDGDTVRLENGKIVRLIGINTPEIGSKSECFGREAADYADKLLLNKQVKLEKDISETDRYNRLLRYIWLDGELINEKLVADGYAQVATYPPDVKYQARFLAAQTKARNASLNLWSGCALPTTKPTRTTIFTPTKTIPPPINNTAINQPISNSGSYTCNCSKTCANMGCAEAQYQLNTCGCTARDGDDDGTACDSQCQ